MRWILVDRARQKNTERHGGALSRIEMPPELEANLGKIPDLVAFDEILSQLDAYDPIHAEYVKMRFFAGFTHSDTAAALNMTPRQADHIRAVSRVWLLKKLGKT
jgi:hypothetical protein